MAGALANAMANTGSVRPTSILVLDHDAALRWPRDRSELAITLNFVDAQTRDEPTMSHMLVMFVTREAFEGEIERDDVAADFGTVPHGEGAGGAPWYGSLAALLLLAAAGIPRRSRA
ncbi:MAG: hypothetical protein ACRELC_11800 [Gemmatimonadota bacterium]